MVTHTVSFISRHLATAFQQWSSEFRSLVICSFRGVVYSNETWLRAGRLAAGYNSSNLQQVFVEHHKMNPQNNCSAQNSK